MLKSQAMIWLTMMLKLLQRTKTPHHEVPPSEAYYPQSTVPFLMAPPTHARTAMVYANISASKEHLITKRADQTMLARIRSGHSLLFRAYKHRISSSGDPHCRRCNSGADDNLEHWLDCDGTLEERMKIFGYTRVELSDLTQWPRESVALARKTLFRGAERG